MYDTMRAILIQSTTGRIGFSWLTGYSPLLREAKIGTQSGVMNLIRDHGGLLLSGLLLVSHLAGFLIQYRTTIPRLALSSGS